MSKVVFKRASPFAFPGGDPGFDPSHVASSRIRFSAIASRSTFRSLLNGAVGTPTGSVAGIDGRIGPAAVFHDGTSDNIAFSGTAQSLTNNATVAAIFIFNGSSNFNTLFSTGVNSPWVFGNRSTFGLEFDNGNTFPQAGIVPVAGVPYFAIGSANASTVNFLLKRLDTGAVLTSSVTGSTSAGTESNYLVGNYNNSSNSWNGQIAAVMYAANYMSLSQMLQWAQDPWDFWYPNQFNLMTMLAKISSAAAAKQSRSLMGIGQ